MTLTDAELTLYIIREAQLILDDFAGAGSKDSSKTIEQLTNLFSRADIRAAIERLETEAGLKLA